jgi:hypothetical protein
MDTTANANANANTSDTTPVMASLIRRNASPVVQPLPVLKRTSSFSAKRQQTGNNVNPTEGKQARKHSQEMYARNSATARKMISNTVSRGPLYTGTQETRLEASGQRFDKKTERRKKKITTAKKSGSPAKRAMSLTIGKQAQLPRTTQTQPSPLRRSQKATTRQSGGRRTRKRKQRQTRRK